MIYNEVKGCRDDIRKLVDVAAGNKERSSTNRRLIYYILGFIIVYTLGKLFV